MRGRKEQLRGQRLRVVLDTNVYLSALRYPDRELFKLWSFALEGRYILISSPAIIREFASKLRNRFQFSEEDIVRYIKTIAGIAELVSPKELPDAIPEDSSDNHILACALAGKADLIVSGDKDLLRLKEYQGIGIIRPIDLLRTLGE